MQAKDLSAVECCCTELRHTASRSAVRAVRAVSRDRGLATRVSQARQSHQSRGHAKHYFYAII